jgi:NAD+ synthase (glutamine-hydrolysing)
VTKAAREDPEGEVAQECRRVCKMDAISDTWVPENPQEVANHVLLTTFMGTDNSSENTESRARRLAEAIGSYHLSIKIDLMVQAILQVFTMTTGHTPRFSSRGGTMSEDLALQNIQARLRMVMAYLYAQLLPWVRGRSGFLLVLGSANVDEGLRGYMTKYDCSSADLNLIGAISKQDLKRMLLWAAKEYDYDILLEIAGAPPTAELRPLADENDAEAEHTQLDEEEMGMTYEELGYFGKLRKISRCGPVSMYVMSLVIVRRV